MKIITKRVGEVERESERKRCDMVLGEGDLGVKGEYGQVNLYG